MTEAQRITVAYGDGIGPEIMEATLKILVEAGAQLAIDVIEVGEQVYKRGVTSGIPKDAWDVLRRNKVLLKAPITTPQGGGYKSLNVTLRKTLGLYANVRPCVSYHPYVKTDHHFLDVVIVRENEEDIYAGIEHRQTRNTYQSLKLITETGSERIARYAFEYAKKNGREKVTCMSKDNIMKLCDGTFHQAFDRVAKEYPDIETEHYIIDIGSARIAVKPEIFDVIVTENLYGDIISDIAAEISGSVGLAGSANIGQDFAMFEAIHGSAPDIAGKNIANPSGLLQGAVMMLVHLGQGAVAAKIHNAWLRTIEKGQHTADIYDADLSKEKLGTQEFADAVIAHLGEQPMHFRPVHYEDQVSENKPMDESGFWGADVTKTLVGTDVFLDLPDGDFEAAGQALSSLGGGKLKLQTISSKGLKIWPDVEQNGFRSDHFCCRFMADGVLTHTDVVALLGRIAEAGFDFIKTEHLYEFDGVAGYSKGQGE